MKALLTLLMSAIWYCTIAQPLPSGTPTAEEYRFLMKREFRLLVTNTNGTAPGGFAGLDLTEGKASFSPAYQFEHGSVLSAKVNAGATEGLAYLFKRELNTNVSLGVEFNFIPQKQQLPILGQTKFLETDFDQVASYNGDKAALNSQFQTDTMNINSGAVLREQREKLSKKFQADYADSVQNYASWLVIQQQSFHQSLQRLRLEILAINNLLNNQTQFKHWRDAQIKIVEDKQAQAMKLLGTGKIKVDGFQIIWFTLGGQVRRDAFKRFDPTLDYENRLIDEKYSSHQLYGKLSVYRRSSQRTKIRYFSLGVLFNSKSNFQDLTSTEITVQNDYGSNGPSSMASSKKYTAYIGDYKKQIREVTINADYYGFFNNIFAVHTYCTYRLCDGIRPELNFGMGLLHPFAAAKDEKNFVNAEIFYTITNIWRMVKDELKLADQGRLGVRFTFPINFN